VIYAQDFCEARARGIGRSRPVIRQNATSGIYARDFRERRARKRAIGRSKPVLKQNASSGIYARDFREARARTIPRSRHLKRKNATSRIYARDFRKARARTLLSEVAPFFYCRYNKEKHYFRDLRPGFPRGARAVFVEVDSLAKRYFRDLCAGFPRSAHAQYWRSRTVIKQNATSGIYARDFRGARTRTPNPSK
jgi:hypothetical protein